MWEVFQNPPLATYFAALVASVAGWSETALHLGFILPALGVVLGTYRLALRLTRRPLLAAAATLLTPGFLVSASGLMCDTMMLALWVMAVTFWIEGMDEPVSPLKLAISGTLIAACALTKYFGVALIPLLLAYSLARKRRLGSWVAFLFIPIALLGAYELWTHALYGLGLLSAAFNYAGTSHQVSAAELTKSSQTLVGLAFAGGCALPVLTCTPLLWSRRKIAAGGLLSGLLALAFFRGWINLGTAYASQNWAHDHLAWVSIQMLFYMAGGISLFALAIADVRKSKDAASLLLLLWVFGTLVFAIYLNWAVTARSILPMVPAAAILIARRLDQLQLPPALRSPLILIVPLLVSGAVSLWVTSGDKALANTARMMANYIHQTTPNESETVEFEGHWGFQYYMQLFGAHPLERDTDNTHPGDLIVIPLSNANLFDVPEPTTGERSLDVAVNSRVATMSKDLGAGFYASYWGPLPFAICPVPNERYALLRVTAGRRAP